jgi:hypothetical protein
LVAREAGRPARLVVECRPNWYWYPAAIYPYPDPFTPPYQASGYWYWCDFYQNYYPNVASCPSEWEAVGPQ